MLVICHTPPARSYSSTHDHVVSSGLRTPVSLRYVPSTRTCAITQPVVPSGETCTIGGTRSS
ncbi:MAG TPA: hypothetical protein VLM79_21300 [Kofleriaceae bacterium]|nr:hypothetical protein [Kofleriaceae bacterium]